MIFPCQKKTYNNSCTLFFSIIYTFFSNKFYLSKKALQCWYPGLYTCFFQLLQIFYSSDIRFLRYRPYLRADRSNPFLVSVTKDCCFRFRYMITKCTSRRDSVIQTTFGTVKFYRKITYADLTTEESTEIIRPKRCHHNWISRKLN